MHNYTISTSGIHYILHSYYAGREQNFSLVSRGITGIMSTSTTRADSIRQAVNSELCELLVKIYIDDWAYARQCELHIDDKQLRLQHPNAQPLVVSFVLPIQSSSAKAKLSMRARALVVRAQLATACSSHPGALRATITGCGRGVVLVHWTIPEAGKGDTCYALVSRSGSLATCEQGGYTWCRAYPALLGGTRVSCRFDVSAWVWDEPDALITLGVVDSVVPCIPSGTEQVGVVLADSIQACAKYAGGTSAAEDEERPAVEYEFISDWAMLPTAALRAACRCYNASFAAVDGYGLSRAHTSQRPPPPQWHVPVTASAPDGLEVDQYYTTLTYGEAEFLPLYRLLAAVGVADGSVVVDLGSGTGRVVLGVALGFPAVAEVRGIELVPGLHAGALQAHARVQDEIDEIEALALEADAASVTTCAPVRFIHGDILSEEWTDADLVFVTSLCFPPSLVAQLQLKAAELRPGARVLCMQASFDESMEDEDDGDRDEEWAVATNTAGDDMPGGTRDGARVCTWLRPVVLNQCGHQDSAAKPGRQPHELPTQMSFGETTFYLYERV